jgi:hypothetical protein
LWTFGEVKAAYVVVTCVLPSNLLGNSSGNLNIMFIIVVVLPILDRFLQDAFTPQAKLFALCWTNSSYACANRASLFCYVAMQPIPCPCPIMPSGAIGLLTLLLIFGAYSRLFDVEWLLQNGVYDEHSLSQPA